MALQSREVSCAGGETGRAQRGGKVRLGPGSSKRAPFTVSGQAAGTVVLEVGSDGL